MRLSLSGLLRPLNPFLKEVTSPFPAQFAEWHQGHGLPG